MCPKRSRSLFDVVGSSVNSLRELGWETGHFEQQVRDRFQQFGRRMSTLKFPPGLNWVLESGKNYATENPLTALTLLALGITCAIPVVVFLSFAFATLLITFIGFLFVEGTLLTIASVFLGGVLLVVGFFTLTFVSCGLLAYLATTKVYSFITGDKEPHRFLTRLPIIGPFFVSFEHSGTNGDAMKIPNGYEDDDTASDESLAHTD